MQSLQRSATSKTLLLSSLPNLCSSAFAKTQLNLRLLSAKSPSNNHDDDGRNNAWEAAWLPEDLPGKAGAPPWEDGGGVASPTTGGSISDLGWEADAETKAFVEDMDENWSGRRKGPKKEKPSLDSLANARRDHRLMKQRIHAALWMKEIAKQEEKEAKLGDPTARDGGHGAERMLGSCSEYKNNDLVNSKTPGSSELKSKPDGWETTPDAQDGNVREISQREEDILLQEYERRLSFCKFKISTFIKNHIFSRRRPIHGWKYMIEELRPNERKE